MQTKRVWYAKNLEKDSPDLVHQILMYGTLEEIEELKKTLGTETVKSIFLASPQKIYTNTALNFIKKFILHIDKAVDEQQYLKHTPRYIGQ